MFSLDGKMYQISVYIYHLLIANFLFLLTSLFIITIPASFVSLIIVVENLDRDEVVKRYMEALKKNFFLTVPIGIFNILSVLFLQTIQQITVVDSLFIRMIIYLFVLFLISYNITLSLVFVKKNNIKITISFFQETFVWTIIVFYRFFIITVVISLLLISLLKFLPIIIILMGFSFSTFLYVTNFNRIFKEKKH